MYHVHYTYTERKQNKTKQTNKHQKKKGRKRMKVEKKELCTSDSLTVDSKWPMGQINT